MGNSQESHAPGAPRNALPRRRRSDQVATERVRALLAKLLSTLLGALLGFFVAHLISIIFAGPFYRLLDEASANLQATQQELTQREPEYIKAREDFGRLAEKSGATPPGTAAVSPSAVDDGAPATSGPADAQPNSQLELARQVFTDLRKQREKLQRDITFWQGQIDEHRGNINLLDLLSAAVVLILVLLGYATHPLMRRAIDHVGSGWGEFFGGPEPRTNQAVIGFFAGLILAIVVLLAIFNVFGASESAFSSPPVRLLFGAIIVGILGIAGALVGVAYFSPAAVVPDAFGEFRKQINPHVLDTSIVIDGRIHDIAAAGFLNGALVVTHSVLRELQNMSDSADERKRKKGRRGLELLREMQDDPRVDVRVFDDISFDGQAHGTDEQLIFVAQAMDGVVVTNDSNLNRVAAIRNVRVLNINVLANAVKSNSMPGDIIEVHIIDRGKQRGQGVAYLEDGTMVVVEDGEPYIGKTKSIKLTNVSQTVQGRLIFGRVDLADEELAGNGH